MIVIRKKNITSLYFIYFILTLLPNIINSIVADIIPLSQTIVYWRIVLILFAFILSIFFIKRDFKISIKNICFLLIYFLALFITMIINNSNISSTLFSLGGFILCFYVFYLIPENYSISKDQLIKFCKMIVFLEVLFCLYNLIDNFSDLVTLSTILNPYSVSFSSIFENRNTFGFILFLGIIANTIVYLTDRRKISVVYNIILILSLIFTFSRASMIATIAFFIILYLLKGTKKRFLNSIKYITPFIILFMLLRNDKIYEFFQKFILRTDYADSGRTDIWMELINYIVGTNSYFGIPALKLSQILDSGLSAHNLYLEILINDGILILLLYLYLFLRQLFLFNKIKNIDSNTGLVFISGFIGILILCFFETPYFFEFGYKGLSTLIFFTIPIMYFNKLIKEKCYEKHTKN